MTKTVKVAIVGSGLAGLVAAHSLAKYQNADEEATQFEVHIFEKASTLGMDSSSISLPIPGTEREWRIDVPMRSFQGGYYPKLIELYKSLGIAFRQTDFSYSFSLLSPMFGSRGRRITAAMIYNGASGLSGVSMPSKMKELTQEYKSSNLIFRLLVNAWSCALFGLLAVQLGVCYLRLLVFCIPIFRIRGTERMTFATWAERTTPRGVLARWTGFDTAWKDFTCFVLGTLFSGVCTASETEIMGHPIEEFLDYIWLTLGTHHYAVSNGVQDVVSRIIATAPSTQIHLSSPITSLEADSEHPSLTTVHYSGSDGPKTIPGFNHIIFATQANRAYPILETYLASLPSHLVQQREFVQEQIRCLKTFTYAPTVVVNHTDDTLLPDNPSDRRDLCFVNLAPYASLPKSTTTKSAGLCVDASYTMTTHILSRPKDFPAHLPDVFQTTNPIIPPKEGKILSVSRLDRAVVNFESKEALKDLHVEVGRRFWQSAGQGEPRLGRLQGHADSSSSGIWICGSFAYSGIPLLEGCVRSAHTVVTQGICESENVSW